MELWIRSQKGNKNIIQSFSKVSNLWICDAKPTTIEDHDGPLGEYKTKERALEVLDEIQRCMTINCSASGDYETLDIKLKELYLQHRIVIYNMPKE